MLFRNSVFPYTSPIKIEVTIIKTVIWKVQDRPIIQWKYTFKVLLNLDPITPVWKTVDMNREIVDIFKQLR